MRNGGIDKSAENKAERYGKFAADVTLIVCDCHGARIFLLFSLANLLGFDLLAIRGLFCYLIKYLLINFLTQVPPGGLGGLKSRSLEV